MTEIGSPLDDAEREQNQGSVSPPSSHHAFRSSTPGISSLNGTSRYLFSPPYLPRLRSTSLPPPDTDMAIRLAYHLAPARESQRDLVNFASESAPAGLALPLSRPQHLPDTPLPDAIPIVLPELNADKVPSVNEIIRLLRLQKYHQSRCHQAEDGLYRLQIAAARTDRLVRAARSAQHTLAECIKSEDKASFVNLLHAFRDASDTCLAAETRAATEMECGHQSNFRSFMDSLSTNSRAAILNFLSQIRYDGAFIADHLESLTHKELVDMLSDRGTSRQGDSIFGSSSRWSSRTSKPLGFVVDANVDTISSFSYGSVLETLIHSIQGLNAYGGLERERSINLWATVCARLISKQKPGSESLVPAILDIWVSSIPWPAKDRLELWILKTLQEGSFLLDRPSKQTFRARVEGRSDIPPEDEVRAEAFYTQAVDSLLGLLGENLGSTVIPPGALAMCRAIWANLADSPGHQHNLPQFIITRWLCSSFLVDVLTIPEAHCLLTDHYVPEIARQRILREIATRTQKAVYEVAYSWKHGTKASVEVTQRVNTIMALMQTGPSTHADHNPDHHMGCHARQNMETPQSIVITLKDVLVCMNALYPTRRPVSVSSDYGSVTSGLQSSASSISGFSLFRNAKAPEDHSDAHTPQSPRVPVNRSEKERLFEPQPMHEACLELEDLVTAAPLETWAVLVISPGSARLCTMTEHLSRIGSQDGTTVERQTSGLGAAFHQHSSSLHAVELLLCRSINTVDESPAAEPAVMKLVSDFWTKLEELFEEALAEYESQSDFVGAHFWFQQFQELREYVSQSAKQSALKLIVDGLQDTAHASIELSLATGNACEKWSAPLRSYTQLQSEQLEPLLQANERLRDKMWYVADVRTSAAYDETRSIAAALRVMGRPKKVSRTHMAPPLRHWSGRIPSTSLQLKSEAQILEMLSAKPEHGGTNKLSDEQSKITASWLERQNIDNLCKGEERLHKFCMEIRKCVDSIINSPFESSTISTNALFTPDNHPRSISTAPPRPSALSGLYGNARPTEGLSLHSHIRGSDALSGSSRALSSASSRDYIDSRSPTLTNRSSMPFWSPAITEADSPSSATSVGDSLRQTAIESSQYKRGAALGNTQRQPLDRLRERLTGLLLSDFSYNLFGNGSETDLAFWTGLGSDLVDKQLRSLHPYQANIGQQTPTRSATSTAPSWIAQFSFECAFDRLLRKFSWTLNPSTKLDCLFDIDRLLVPYMAQQDSNQSTSSTISTKETSGEISVRGFQYLFSQRSMRPATIFRDMQYIAALLPSSTLQGTPHGKAFCNAAVAIAGLKLHARKIMVETADSIIAYHSNNRGHGRSPSTAQQQRDSAIFTAPSRSSSAEDVARYTMADAAYLLQITAKEGDHVAQRELATLYLTHPELMDRIIAPFARPKEVFREELEGRWRRNQDPNRCDPMTMCVAHHWMNLSSKGGDSLAKEYLKQREEMDNF